MMLQIAGIKMQLAVSSEHCPETEYFKKACADYSVSEDSEYDFKILWETFKGTSNFPKALFTRNGVSYLEKGTTSFFYSDSSACRISWTEKTAALSFAPNIDRYDILCMDYIKLVLSFIAIERGGLPLHSSAVHREGNLGILFFCQSGGGKTTIARLLSQEWKVLSDEFNMIMPENGTYYIYSTPFTASENYPLCSPGRAPACVFYALSKSPSNRLTTMTFRDKYIALGKGIYTIAATEAIGAMLLRNMQDICSRIPMQRLFFINNQSIVNDIKRFQETGNEV
jgi:hypothetical protein